MKEALFYKKLKDKNVQCRLCPHFCALRNNEAGKCKIRKNINGILYSLSYERPVAVNIDPVEKKPLYNLLPGTKAFSVGMLGCNLKCDFCQNWDISQEWFEEIPVQKVRSKEIVERALESKCPVISYTYSEPLVSYEYVLEIAKLAKKEGLKNTIVSNGYINEEPLKELGKFIDGANIDLKAFSNDFYVKLCKARLQPVLETIKKAHELGIWIEITTLIIPGKNDSNAELEKIADFISNIDENIPWHVTAFHPDYKMKNIPSTSYNALYKAYNIGRKRLKYVYVGNILDEEHSSTYCPNCKTLMIRRNGYFITIENFANGKCGNCGEKISGVWK